MRSRKKPISGSPAGCHLQPHATDLSSQSFNENRFDVRGVVLESLKKTSRIVFVDEDVPGGATAYMMQKVLTEQGGYPWLDSAPRTVASQEHRPAYGSDGDHWSKPQRETVFEAAYELMHEAEPARFPLFFR